MSAGNWWAKRWESLLQEWGIASANAKTNRAYRIKSLEVLPGVINATVQDRESGACRIEVKLTTLRPEQWEQVGEILSGQPLVSNQLLSGAIAPEIEQIFAEAGAHLLPAAANEISTHCSCCSPAPCRHLPQVFNLFAEMLNDDPSLLFALRGRDRQQILRDIRDARGVGAQAHAQGANESAPALAEESDENAAEAQAGSLAAEIDQYWGNRTLIKQFQHHIAPPAVELSLLRRLGPLNTSDDSMAIYEQLVALYRRITEEALGLAYAVDEEPGEQRHANGTGGGHGGGSGSHHGGYGNGDHTVNGSDAGQRNGAH